MNATAGRSGEAAASGVVLLGGAHGALSAARSFGRLDIPVAYVTDDHPLPGFSRYVDASFTWPGATSPGAVDWLIDFAATHRLQGWLLIPCADGDVKCVAENLALLRGVFRIISADWQALQQVCDKQRLAATALEAGVACPRNYVIRSAEAVARTEIDFPVVLKPATRMERNAFTAAKAWRADSREELIALHARASAEVGGEDVVVQELVPGGGEAQFSYAGLWHGNRPVADMTARRTRQYPVEFSMNSTFVEVVDNAAVRDAGRRLLSAIGFEGLVEVEFKYDARSGSYKVLDVNPRPWSWFGLCAAAGLDLAVLMREVALGSVVAPAAAEPGWAWMQASRDVVAAGQLIWRGDLRFADYIAGSRQQLTYAAFAWDDPIPGLMEVPLTVYRVLSRLLPEWATTAMPNRGRA
ncbi:ATP-grasp domain-containing protein [Bradyrhizobium sp. U87765 SZCCT0131]|uniref:carboxylate--amine ligase n=1 Tax=unclassified Bradyrhizobium TaxID=2631580 RepID=UPI001BAB96AC|nr:MULTISPECIES: ATP-grasp domain-containing protein [unclassified Bradyrhizobium]MBR1223086.1 ATP-grasp domain-containing protein [Bradyrhizobium sp. U87765 SZCCT0131]MBR1265870.1 ATP-grasp domain-containing protein [Bradyrhizobium sp. U87765 SZCCT0134]MBR1308706.1 ATP-grasp domain-containing protein [Bradyrhizobium sp. U87765 SZCCT0110]MBR1318604.1 ATP-grasp domain-containing protein [Bradyrhizobium sp. U87765 SZCCT0109]MBR1352308.1 ATP-grasp domain-containing protein [Bradyrhizobium sp. U87